MKQVSTIKLPDDREDAAVAPRGLSTPQALGSLALGLTLGFYSSSCSGEGSESAAQTQTVRAYSFDSDPDYKRWRDTLISTESEQAFSQYLKFERSQVSPQQAPAAQELTFATAFTYDVAIDALTRSEKLLKLSRVAQEFLSGRELPEASTALDVALRAATSLEYDSSYRRWSDVQDFSDKLEYNCEEIVVSYVANLLTAQAQRLMPGEQASIALVTGMFYDNSLPGNGGGHAWIRLSDGTDNCYIDPTLDLDRGKSGRIVIGDARYIAIAEQEIDIEKDARNLKISIEPPTLLRLPRPR